MVTYYDSFVGFRLFQLVSLNIRWAPVASRPSVGYNWAWHLWDMSSTSAFSHSASLCVYFSLCLSPRLRMRPSGLCWWSQASRLEMVWARQVYDWNTTRSVYCLVLATEPSWSPSAEHFTFGTLLIYTCTDELHGGLRSGIMNKIIISKYQWWNYPFLSASFSRGGGGGGRRRGGGDRHRGLRSNCKNLSEEMRGAFWTVDSLTVKQESEERPPDFRQTMCERKRIPFALFYEVIFVSF